MVEKKSTVSLSEGGRPAWVTKGEPPVVGLRRLHSDDAFDFGYLERLTIGSGSKNDLVLDDPTVSASHCEVQRERERVTLQDTNSRNGTYINGIRCQRVDLRDGVIIAVGRTHLVAYSDGNRNRRTARERLAGHHPKFLRALETAERAAFEGQNILVIGEAGTGKTLLARVIHEIARGPGMPFVEVDCNVATAAQELFGDTPTALDRAAGGTLYVREPAKLSQRNIGRLFESLRERGTDEPASLRLVAATSHVTQAIRSYELIAPVIVTLPPLRDRKTDLRDLVSMFLAELVGKQHKGLSRQTMAAFKRHDWPGNVAELHEAVRRVVALASSRSLREWAEKLGKPRATLQRWLGRMDYQSKECPVVTSGKE